jgi:hypothetical protein
MRRKEYNLIMWHIRQNSVYDVNMSQNVVTVHDVRVILEREVK